MALTRLEIESPVVQTRRRIEKPILRTDKLVKIYGGRSVVNGIDIHVNEGEIVGLLGPNGAGKTTTFYLIVGLVRPNGGRVYFQDRDVTGFAMHRRARMGMGYLPQRGIHLPKTDRRAEHHGDPGDTPNFPQGAVATLR